MFNVAPLPHPPLALHLAATLRYMRMFEGDPVAMFGYDGRHVPEQRTAHHCRARALLAYAHSLVLAHSRLHSEFTRQVALPSLQ